LIVFRFARRRRKRIVEILGAILALVLVITSGYLSPVVGDRIAEIKHIPRKITAEQKSAFIKALNGIKRGPVLVKTNELDNEAQNYMSDIRSLLDDAGYPGDAVTEMGSRIISDHSVSFILKNAKNAPEYVGSLQRAFERIGIDALAIIPLERVDWLKDGDTIVFINKKPE
jgi:hypothetical protein